MAAALVIGGMAFLGSFSDLLTDQEANDTAAEFVREQIRRIVKHPETAELLAADACIARLRSVVTGLVVDDCGANFAISVAVWNEFHD